MNCLLYRPWTEFPRTRATGRAGSRPADHHVLLGSRFLPIGRRRPRLSAGQQERTTPVAAGRDRIVLHPPELLGPAQDRGAFPGVVFAPQVLARELPWTANLAILGRARQPEEREFYLRLAAVNRWSARELGRQIDSALFERSVLAPPKLSSALREIHPQAAEVFKDSYTLEFLGLEDRHSEADLHRGLLRNLGRFLTELGSDFCFVGSEYPIQVGRQDFALDLLFFHRGLACLVAIELKVREFRPEDLGKLSFYLEALDRDVRKPHERPSIGLLLCATRDEEVVEYALCRTLSPALVAEYQTALPQKAVLQAKLHELYEQLALTDGTRTEDEAHSPETTGGQR